MAVKVIKNEKTPGGYWDEQVYEAADAIEISDGHLLITGPHSDGGRETYAIYAPAKWINADIVDSSKG